MRLFLLRCLFRMMCWTHGEAIARERFSRWADELYLEDREQ